MLQQEILSILKNLEQESNRRQLHQIQHHAPYIKVKDKTLLNLASNDYLGIAQNFELQKKFLSQTLLDKTPLSSSSSRSLSGNFEIFEIFENKLKQHYNTSSTQKEALLFNSGYHTNIGIIDALAQIPNTLFLADSFVHASIFDGLRLSRAKFFRFPHQDIQALEQLLQTYRTKFKHIIILTEGLFSMDGDFCHLSSLIKLKNQYQALLYVDEAHSFGVYGENLLGICKEKLDEVDFLILAFGKALGSVGGAVICDKVFRDFFINKARSFIYSTAIAPLSVAWSDFIFSNLSSFEAKAHWLQHLSQNLIQILNELELEFIGQSHIISILAYENHQAIFLSDLLWEQGIFAPAIKSPTVPKGSARIRLSLHANLTSNHLDFLIQALKMIKKSLRLKKQ